jgi:hypothetical protein
MQLILLLSTSLLYVFVCPGPEQLLYYFGESLLLRKLILGIQAQVRGKSLTELIIICDALIRPASTHKNPRGVFI